MDIDHLIRSFIILWAAIDPIGTIPVFISITRGHSSQNKIKMARTSSFIAFGVLIFFLIIGNLILKKMGIPLSAFQTSGGVILFLLALNMIFGDSKPEEEIQLAKNSHETAIFPLAIPAISGPGAILTVVLLADHYQGDIISQSSIALVIFVILLINFLLMCLAKKVHKKIGNSGAIIISKVMGLILASIAANNILMGIKEFFSL